MAVDYTAYAGNDLTITVTATDDDGDAVVLVGVVDADYVIATQGGTSKVAKTLADGITVNASGQVVIEIARADTLALSGNYRHELTILDSQGVTTTLLYGEVSFLGTLLV